MSQMLDVNDVQRSDYERQEFHNLPRPHWLDAAVGPKVLDPGPDYIAPSLFSHTAHVNQPIPKMLRSKDLADRIMKHYWVRRYQQYLFLFFSNIWVARHSPGAELSSYPEDLSHDLDYLP